MSDFQLDIEAPESFEFTAGGHKYRMRYMTTEETLKLEEEEDSAKLLLSLITPVSSDSPSFEELTKGKNAIVHGRLFKLYQEAAKKAL